MTFLPAFAVDGGRIPAQMLRMVAWVATSGATGIVSPNDLRVQALPTPAGSVNILPGGAIIATKFTNSSQTQSYAVANDAAVSFDITATGSGSGRTDYLIVRIDDPQYAGQVPSNPLDALYCRPVVVSSIDNLTYPFVPLAKIVLPASTATVTNAMITDLRKVANPRTLDVLRPIPVITGDTGLVLNNKTTGEWFPNNPGPQAIDIPTWATRAQIECEWLFVQHTGGNENGKCWVEYGPFVSGSRMERSTQQFAWDAGGNDETRRTNWKVADDVYIPANYRGTTQSFVPEASRSSVSVGTTQMDAYSGMCMRVRFLEVADPLAN